MSDGFLDFTVGENDEKIGKRSKRFSLEDGRTYRASFGWLSVPVKNSSGETTGWNDEAAWQNGRMNPEAQVRFTGCERIYKEGVGNFLYKGPAYARFGQPKQYVATVLVVWPTDKDGDLDKSAFAAGKGWAVQPWIFSTDKYASIKKSHKRSPLTKCDMALECPVGGATFQKVNFIAETDNLLMKLAESSKPEYKAVFDRILADIRAVSENIHREMARDLTIDQILEALGESGETPTGSSSSSSHVSKNVDDLLIDTL